MCVCVCVCVCIYNIYIIGTIIMFYLFKILWMNINGFELEEKSCRIILICYVIFLR